MDTDTITITFPKVKINTEIKDLMQIANEKYTILQPKSAPLYLKKINKYRPYFPPSLTSNQSCFASHSLVSFSR